MKKVIYIFLLLIAASSAFSQWTQTSGPSGGGVSDFAFVDGKILAVSFDAGNGVFASTDDGVTWHESGLQGIMLSKIAANGNTVITASTNNSYNETDTIYRSSDAGISWQKVEMIDSFVSVIPNINGITSICHHGQKWFISAQGQKGRMFTSIDDGVNWTASHPALFNFSRPVTLLSFGKYLIAGTDVSGVPQILRSQNEGQTWIDVAKGGLLTQIHCGFVSGNTIWLGVVGGVIYSNDSGYSWTKPDNKGIEHREDEFMRSIAASGNHLVAISSLNNIYYSWDGGGGWTKFSGNGLPANASYFFSVSYFNGSYLLGGTTGILRSSDGGTVWQYSTAGLRSASISQLGSYQGNIFAATERGVSFSSNQGQMWHDPQNPNDLNDIPISGFLKGVSSFYAYGAGLYSWSGSSWNTVNTTQITNLAEGASAKLFATIQSSDPIEGTGGIYFSDNGGTDWKESLTFKNTIDTEYYFLSHCMASHDGSIVAIQRAVAFQTFTDKYYVYRSGNNGASWTVSEIANSPSFLYYADNEFYIGTYGGGLLHSADGGLTWFNDKSLRSDCDVTSLIKAGNTLLLSGSGTLSTGLYWSNDDGANWKFGNTNSSNISGPLAYDGTYIYSGGPSVWRRSLDEMGVKSISKIANLQALQLYPNPATDIINIRLKSVDPLYGSIVISDEKGVVIFKSDYKLVSISDAISISTRNFSNGIFGVKFLDRSGNEMPASKFVIIKK